MTAGRTVEVVKAATQSWDFDRISLGYPGPIINGRPLREPHNLGGGWVGFDFQKAFGREVFADRANHLMTKDQQSLSRRPAQVKVAVLQAQVFVRAHELS